MICRRGLKINPEESEREGIEGNKKTGISMTC